MDVDEDADAPVAEELEDNDDMLLGTDAQPEEEGSDADAEGEDDDEGEFVGAVKTRSARSRNVLEDEESAVEDPDHDEDSDDSSQAEDDWEAADDAEEDQKVSNIDANRCV